MIKYIGVNDHDIDLFEGQYVVKNGMSYNSYVIFDEKIAVMDTVDINFKDEWLNKLDEALEGRLPDYLVVHHMEPDHSASIEAFLNKYPNTTLVTNMKAYKMVGQFFPNLKVNSFLEVKENQVLDLGEAHLKFIMAPMVHWPEVMMSYEESTKSLFSADAFGKFGANDVEDEWLDEARRYYIGIVGKYGSFVQKLFAKLGALEINNIYSLHGPALTENIPYYLGLYDTWSKYEAETDGVLIAYASIYGNTKKAAEMLSDKLDGVNHTIIDLAREDIHEAVAQAFRYSKLVIASPTYNTVLFPVVNYFIDHLVERGYTNRSVAVIENGTWGPMAKKNVLAKMEGLKDITFLDTTVTIKSAINDETVGQIEALAEELKK